MKRQEVDQQVWATFAKVDRVRDPNDHVIDPVLAADPGPTHAYQSVVPKGVREPEFYAGDGPMAICGTRVLVRLPIPFGGDDPDSCPDCAKRVAQGRLHPPPRPGSGFRPCGHSIQYSDDDGTHDLECRLRPRHDGMHRARSGESWEHGPEDLVPPPDGYV